MKKVDFEDLGVSFDSRFKTADLECNVTDTNTNTTMSEAKDIKLTRYEYKVEKISSPYEFKPLKDYKAIVSYCLNNNSCDINQQILLLNILLYS